MQPNFKYLIAILCLFLYSSCLLQAQIVIGPSEVYVSEQNPIPFIISQQSEIGSADEGRVINIKVTDIQGPIEVSPTEYDLNGPPCPTYTPNGQRIPTTPLPNNSANFQGNVKFKYTQVPAAGTTAQASFKVKDYGYWTVCSKQEKKYFPDEYIVRYNINSIQLLLSTTKISCCKGKPGRIDIKSIYPAGVGAVSWSSSNDHISVSGDNTGANIIGDDYGDAVITATLTVGQATFLVHADAKVGEIVFKSPTKNVLWYPGGTFDATTMLADNSLKKDLKWSLKSEDKKPATIDESSGKVTYAESSGIYTIKAESAYDATCKAEFILTVARIAIKPSPGESVSVCDGDPGAYKLVTVPDIGNDLSKDLAYKFSSDPKYKSNGNPAGTTDLKFSAVDKKDMTFKVEPALWYEYAEDKSGSEKTQGCNSTAVYVINGTTTIQGTKTDLIPGDLSVRLASKDCKAALANLVSWYTGDPKYVIKGDGIDFECTVEAGTFKREMKVVISEGNKNSQFYKMAVDEENYHKGQYEGTNGDLIKDLYQTDNVIKRIKKAKFMGVTEADAKEKAVKEFEKFRDEEAIRSVELVRERRCQIEAEAKKAIKATYYARLICSYPRCVE